MTIYFLGKVGNQYPGVASTTALQLATHIRDALVTELGWELVSGTPASLPMRIRSTVAIGGIRCLFEFASHASGLSVQAVDGAILAPAIGTSTSQMSPWVIDTQSNCWITANATAWICSVTSTGGNRVTLYGGWGFWPKTNNVPGQSWVLGRLCHTYTNPSTVATFAFNGVIFRNAAGVQFAALPISNNMPPISGGSTTGTTNLLNARTLAPELSENYHRAPMGEFNGYVQFAVNGLAGFTSGNIYRINTGTKIRVYMACGGSEAGFLVDEYDPP